MRRSYMILTCTCLTVAGCADGTTTGPGGGPPTEVARTADATHPNAFPDVIALPNGFWPEDIAFGRGHTFYVGSLASGAIWRGDARTGTGALLVSAPAGAPAVGLSYDQRSDRLVVAGGFTGQAYVYDASTGATLAVYQLADPAAGPTFVNGVVVTRDAAYFTDDSRPVIYRVPLGTNGHDGALPAAGAVQTLPLTGDFVFVSGAFNANGMVTTPDEKALIVVNTATGLLYLVDPETGHATEIDLGGRSVREGDGVELVGHTLYVVQGALSPAQITVVRLGADFASGLIERAITGADLRFPSSVAAFGSALYAVNARFDVPSGPDVEYQVVRVAR